MRVQCNFDNGTEKQWSVNPHQPGHHGPAKPPLEAPQYIVAGIDRFDEMCVGFLSIEIPAYRGRTFETMCDEAQAIAVDSCGPDTALDFNS